MLFNNLLILMLEDESCPIVQNLIRTYGKDEVLEHIEITMKRLAETHKNLILQEYDTNLVSLRTRRVSDRIF